MSEEKSIEAEPKSLWEYIYEDFPEPEPSQLRMVDDLDLLYPDRLKKHTTISVMAYQMLKEQARILLADEKKLAEFPQHREHWLKLAEGILPDGFSVDLPKD